MELKKWENLPDYMQNEKVKKYYKALIKKKKSLRLKRIFDVVMSIILLFFLWPLMLILAIWIKADSKGPVFFRQERITQYGRTFKIFKFRTMVNEAPKIGSAVTVGGDSRITRVGKIIRKYRLDEIPQLFNVLSGDMTFVGTRPEVEKYVKEYTPAMMATLLLPAGITSTASVEYKDEDKLLEACEDVDYTYVHEVLPGKMKYNLKYLREFSFMNDLKICIDTVLGVIK
ncbi:MAG: sugar transferase [Lachnospiraceae bacterium]|nr:sugar transferase [Lachnospiraceae bacterium]